MLKFILPDKAAFDALDPLHQAEYTEDGSGRYVLQVEGAVPKKQLDDFRQTNIDLRKQVEAFGDITADEAKELRAKKAEFDAGNDKTKIDALVEARVAEMKKTFEAEKATLASERDSFKGKLGEKLIDAALVEAGLKTGLRATAQDDLIARGRNVFRLSEDGTSVIALDKDGNKVFGTDGEPLTPASWVAGLSKTADHLFDPSAGGGSGNQQPGRTTGVKNPWSKEHWNLTEQGKAISADKTMARTLAAAAGQSLDL